MSTYESHLKTFIESHAQPASDLDFTSALTLLTYSEMELKAERDRLSQEVAALRTYQSELLHDKSDLLNNISKQATDIDGLDNQNIGLRQQVETLEKIKSVLEAEQNEVRRLQQILAREAGELRTSLGAVQIERDLLESALSDRQSLIARVEQNEAEKNTALHNILELERRIRNSSAWPLVRLFRSIRRRIDSIGRTANSALAHASAAPAPQPAIDVESAWAFLAEKESKGLFNNGWYGSRPLSAPDRYWQEAIPEALLPLARKKYDRDTARIAQLYPGHSFSWTPFDLCNFRMIEDYFDNRTHTEAPPSGSPSTFSFVTSFYGSKIYFEQLAKSLADLHHEWASGKVEWVIHNDDLSTSNHELMQLTPASIHQFVRIVGGDRHRGVAGGLNAAISASRHEWLLFVDCDDLIPSETINILQHYIRRFPQCRYISSGMIDIGQGNEVLRYRRHDSPPTQIFQRGMIAGHLKAIRRDLFSEATHLNDRFDLSQDYDFALDVAGKENILLIPEYLYCYRWHHKTQSVSQSAKQKCAWRNIIRHHVTKIFTATASHETPVISARPSVEVKSAAQLSHGAAIVRTQGSRLDLLAETLASIENQQFPTTPILSVHGDASTFSKVRSFCADIGSRALVLHAGEPHRLRGYPCNVGMDYVLQNCSKYDVVSFLDDDDIYYPNYSERLIGALHLTGADLVYSQTNKREPWFEHVEGPHLLPSAALVTGNFITNSSFLLRTDALARSKVRFHEDMEYLEDWLFLLHLLNAGIRFAPLFETLSEFRIFSDGNTATKRFPEIYAVCQKRCFDAGKAAAVRLGLPYFYESVFAFDFDRRPPLDRGAIDHITSAREIFEAEWSTSTPLR
ncbi:MAG: glycosyltransferase [Pseudomonadota bacterium]